MNKRTINKALKLVDAYLAEPTTGAEFAAKWRELNDETLDSFVVDKDFVEDELSTYSEKPLAALSYLSGLNNDGVNFVKVLEAKTNWIVNEKGVHPINYAELFQDVRNLNEPAIDAILSDASKNDDEKVTELVNLSSSWFNNETAPENAENADDLETILDDVNSIYTVEDVITGNLEDGKVEDVLFLIADLDENHDVLATWQQESAFLLQQVVEGEAKYVPVKIDVESVSRLREQLTTLSQDKKLKRRI